VTKHFVDKSNPDRGYYDVYTRDVLGGARWQWTEVTATGETITDLGSWWPTLEQAYLDAADDWGENGDSANKHLSGQLSAAATRLRKKAAAAERPAR
jgi:hypothetical protein